MSWHEIALGDAFRVKHGYAFKSEYFCDVGEYLVLTPGNFNEKGGFRLRPGKDRFYNGEIPDEFVLDEGSLIVAMTEQGPGLLGSSALVPNGASYLHNQRLGLIHDLDEGLINRHFLYYLFNTRSVRAQISGSASGTKVRHTAPERIYRVKVRVPKNVAAQKKIALILSAYDDLIENNWRRIQLLERAARLLYKEWFVHLRFPGHAHIKITAGVPEGWERKKTAELVTRVSAGKLYDQESALDDGAVPILDQGRSGLIGFHNEQPSVEATLQQPVIVFANHTCYQRIIHYPFSAIQNVLPFMPSAEHPRNLYWLHHATVDLVKTSAYKGHWPEFMAKEILLPPKSVCDAYGQFVRSQQWMIHHLEQQNKKLAKARDLLLPRLMNGEISV